MKTQILLTITIENDFDLETIGDFVETKVLEAYYDDPPQGQEKITFGENGGSVDVMWTKR